MGGNADLHTAATGYLKKKFRVPDRIASEWLRSPVFVSGQDELNLLVDEKLAAVNLSRRINRAFANKRDPRWQGVQREIIAQLENARGRYYRRESDLKHAINSDLNARTKAMVDQLNDVSSNMQLVEAEIYSNMSEKMISDYHHPNAPGGRSPAGHGDTSAKNSAPVWDWGRFAADSDDQSEVWEDEVGFLKTEVKSRCTAR